MNGRCFSEDILHYFVGSFNLCIFLWVVERCYLMLNLVFMKKFLDFISYKLFSTINDYFPWYSILEEYYSY